MIMVSLSGFTIMEEKVLRLGKSGTVCYYKLNYLITSSWWFILNVDSNDLVVMSWQLQI